MNKIEAAVIHQLVKDRQGPASIVARKKPNDLTGPVVKFVMDVHELYTEKAAKGYGRFETDAVAHPTSAFLRNYFDKKKTSFLETSHKLMDVLADRASKAQLATGGFVLMAYLTDTQGAKWFTVAITTNISSSAIDEKALDVVEAVHVDFQNLRVAGHVNLNDWLSGDSDARYVSFLKQQGAVAEYFKNFLGCSEVIEANKETSKLVEVIKDFAYKSGLKPAEQDRMLRLAYDYGIERYKNDEPLSLEALSNAIYPSRPAALMKAIASSSVSISEGFVPDARVLRSFVRFKAATEYWTLDLEREALIKGKAKYDEKEENTYPARPARQLAAGARSRGVVRWKRHLATSFASSGTLAATQ